MRLTPRELDKLTLHQAGSLAQKRLARGLRLNHPEAVALIRDGRRVSELMDLGRRLLGRRQVMPGVPELVPEVQVEGTFPDGTKLVTVHHPISAEDGDLALALEPDEDEKPGELMTAPGEIELNAGRAAISLAVTNLADRPIQVGSHFP